MVLLYLSLVYEITWDVGMIVGVLSPRGERPVSWHARSAPLLHWVAYPAPAAGPRAAPTPTPTPDTLVLILRDRVRCSIPRTDISFIPCAGIFSSRFTNERRDLAFSIEA